MLFVFTEFKNKTKCECNQNKQLANVVLNPGLVGPTIESIAYKKNTVLYTTLSSNCSPQVCLKNEKINTAPILRGIGRNSCHCPGKHFPFLDNLLPLLFLIITKPCLTAAYHSTPHQTQLSDDEAGRSTKFG